MNERMFTLNVTMCKMNSMMFTHGKGIEDIGIWHMHIGHVNIHCFKLMENQNLVGGLPKFETKEVMPKVCETCQIRKQTMCPFSIQIIHVNFRSL